MRIELANYTDLIGVDRFELPESEVRRYEVDGIVDTSAAQLVLPQAAMDALGLEECWSAKVRYADGHTQSRPVVKNVWMKICDRESVFSAIVEPVRKTALIGAIVMEALDLVVDFVTQELLPRDPNQIIAEIE